MRCAIAPSISPRVRRPDIVEPAVASGTLKAAAACHRRRVVVAATLVAGTSALAGTLAAPSGSGLFYGLGLLSAVTWIVGAFLSGPIPAGLGRDGAGTRRAIVAAVLVGVALFLAFLAATRIAARIPALSDSVTSILTRADAGPRALVLGVALLNGIGEELFFRGAVPAAIRSGRRAVWATVLYALVTVATLNLALVAAAVVMGTVFSAERRVSGGVLVPILTHLSWSTLMILLLPR